MIPHKKGLIMKNKKLIARLGAIFAAVLLVSLMALPCFADEPTVPDDTPAPEQKVLTEYYFDDYAEFYSYITTIDVPELLFPASDASIINLQFTSLLYSDGGAVSVVYSCRTYFFVSLVDVVVIFTENDATIFIDNGVTEYDPEVFTIEELDAIFTSSCCWVYQKLQIPETPDTPTDPDAPTRSGLYGECYYIIRDALYGKNAVLDSTQEFAITQVSTWMTYIVILLPFVVVAIILFRIFFR